MKSGLLHNALSMKRLNFLLLGLFALGIINTACDDENFDAPPHSEPQYLGQSNISISDFKAKYNKDLVEITEDDIIEGVITANDVSGNLYKQIFIEDETGGLMVAIDRNNIYNDLRVGQKIFIETNGLYMGKYGGMPQLGYRYSRDNDGNFSIGQMPWELLKAKVFKDGYPNPDQVVPLDMDISSINADNYGRLVKLNGVFFDDAGEIFSYPTQEGGVQTLNRVIRSANDNSQQIIGRMSSAADFASDTIPGGVGSVTGILTKFNETNQILVREKDDLAFDTNPDGWGIENSPWSVDYALAHMDEDKEGWVTGYIVGAVAPEINEGNPITSNDGISFEAPFLPNTIVIAASADESDWTNCLVINLPAQSDMRTALNLSDNPDLLGEELRVKGSIETILGAGGVRIASGSVDEFRIGGVGEEILSVPFQSSLDPFSQYSVSGSQQWQIDSYGYAKMTGYVGGSNNANEDWLISPSIDLSEYSAVHVTFEHISRYGINSSDFTLWVSSDYSGGDPASATWTQITIANYSSGNSWDDWTNSGNLNIPVDFTGKASVHVALKYVSSNSRAGTWEVKNFIVRSGKGITVDPGSDLNPAGDGTQANPYNLDGAIENQGAAEKAWVTGYIVGAIDNGQGSGLSIQDESRFEGPFSVSSNILIAASPNETNPDNCIPVQLVYGTDARTILNLVDNPGNLGQEVMVYGYLETYYNVPGIKDVSDYVFDGGSSGGGDSNPSDEGDGTRENPYNIASIIANQNATTDKVWSTGYIVGVIEGMSISGAVFTEPFAGVETNLLIAASPTETNPGNCVPVQLPNNDVRPVLNLGTNPENHGKLVLIYGTLESYFGVPGVKNVTNYEIEGVSGDPDQPEGAIILNAAFDTELAPFSSYSVIGAEVWIFDANYGAKMSGYNGAPMENEDWLISPQLDLSGYSAPYVVFDHALNFATDMELYSLMISNDYSGGDPSAATWTELNITTMPSGSDWTFVNSGHINIPAGFLVNEVTIAFKYQSTTSEAGTWEIKNLFVIE